ncbi:MAG: hypothetical protein AAGB25_06355 [Pseudomonadota bacterium]
MRAANLVWTLLVVFSASLFVPATAQDNARPDTGISGVYEVVLGVDEATPAIDYFAEFGFTVVAEAELSENAATKLYGVPSAARVYRLQNGEIDTHGLLRIIEWAEPIGPGVGYAPPETIGQRMAVMRTRDIFRIDDVFNDLRHESEEAWLPTPPVYDDLYDLDEGAYSISNRRVGVREMGVYGEFFNHVFFQRYGYTIPGYGTIGDAPLQTSEFTHHDFIVDGDLSEITGYYVDVLGFVSENDPSLDGDWLKGPKSVFDMENGEAHWYRGFVSPNNICGKLKFFSARDPGYVRDRSENQRLGEPGITAHTLYTPKLSMVHELATDYELEPTGILQNEFDEKSFVFTGPDGSTWQILEAPETYSTPVLEFKLNQVSN